MEAPHVRIVDMHPVERGDGVVHSGRTAERRCGAGVCDGARRRYWPKMAQRLPQKTASKDLARSFAEAGHAISH